MTGSGSGSSQPAIEIDLEAKRCSGRGRNRKREEQLKCFEYPACTDAPAVTEWNGWAEADGELSATSFGARPSPRALRSSAWTTPSENADGSSAGGRSKRARARPRGGPPGRARGAGRSAGDRDRAAQTAARRSWLSSFARGARALSARGRAGGGEAGAGGRGAHSAARGADGSAAADRRGAGGAGTACGVDRGAAARSRGGTRACGREAIALLPQSGGEAAGGGGRGDAAGRLRDRKPSWERWIWAFARSWERSSADSSTAPEPSGLRRPQSGQSSDAAHARGERGA